MNITDEYWNFLNKVARIIGYLMLIVGLAIAAYYLDVVVAKNVPVMVNGVASRDVSDKILVVIVPVIVAFLGWLLIKATYRRHKP